MYFLYYLFTLRWVQCFYTDKKHCLVFFLDCLISENILCMGIGICGRRVLSTVPTLLCNDTLNMFCLHYFRLKPTYWWINWWSVHLITSVVLNQMKARRLMTGRWTEYAIKWNILVSRKTYVLEGQDLPTEDPFRNFLTGKCVVTNTWKIGCKKEKTKYKALKLWNPPKKAEG